MKIKMQAPETSARGALGSFFGAALIALALWYPGWGHAADGGSLKVVSGKKEFSLDARALAALPQHTVKTQTRWLEGVKTFEGPLVSDVLKAAGITALKDDTLVRAQALDGYVVEIPAEDFRRWPVIIAHTMDGKPMTRRDKGPLWLVYPRDSDKTLQDARYDHRWAWQVIQLNVPERP